MVHLKRFDSLGSNQYSFTFTRELSIMVTSEDLHRVAERVRQQYEESHGQCFPASKELRKQYISEFDISSDDIDIEEIRVGDAKTIRHYVVAFPAKEVEDMDVYGRVIIDITLDQYCDELKEEGTVKYSIGPRENIPRINIFPTKQSAPY